MTRSRLFSAAATIALVFAAGPALAQSAPSGDADRLAGDMRVLATSPTNVDTLADAGEASARLGDLSAASALFARADKVDPRNGRVKAGMAEVLLLSERPGEALRYFDQAEGYGYPAARFAAERGLAFDLTGQQGRAQRDYRSVLAAGSNDEVTRRYALSLAISGQKDAALQQLDPLLRHNDRAAWRTRAFVLAMSGDVPGASNIATTMMPPGQGSALQPFFERLPALGPVDRAFAVHFGEVRPTPQRIADARLAPALPPLAPEIVAVAKAPPVAVAAADTKRKKHGQPAPQLAAAAPPSLPTPPAYGTTPAPVAPVQVASAVPAPVQQRPAPRMVTIERPGSMLTTRVPVASVAPAPVRAATAAPIPAAAPPVAVVSTSVTLPAAIAPARSAPVPAVPVAAAPVRSLPADAVAITTPRPSAVASSVSAPPVPAPIRPAATLGASTVSSTPIGPQLPAGVTPAPTPSSQPASSTAPVALAQASAPAPTPVAAPTPPPPSPNAPQGDAVFAQLAANLGASAGAFSSAAASLMSPRPSIVAAAPTPAATPTRARPEPLVVEGKLTPAGERTVATRRTRSRPEEMPAPEASARPSRAGKPVETAEAEAPPAPAAVRSGRRGRAAQPTDDATPDRTGKALADAPPSRTRGRPASASDDADSPPAGKSRRGKAAAADESDADTTPTTKSRRGKQLADADADAKPAKGRRGASTDDDTPDGKTAPRLTAAERRAKAAADKKDAEEKKAAKADPQRYWVQVAGGANEDDLPKAWSAVKGKSATLARQKGWKTPLNHTNRVLAGPFKTDEEARSFVNTLKKEGVSAFQFTSAPGQKVEKLDGK